MVKLINPLVRTFNYRHTAFIEIIPFTFLLCLLSGYSPQGALVSWTVDGSEVKNGVLTSAEEEKNGRYSRSSTLTLSKDLWEKGEEFSNLRGVISVAVVTGQYDLILTVLMNNEFTIKKFYLEEVSKIDDIQSTETWVIYHNVNTKIPYVL